EGEGPDVIAVAFTDRRQSARHRVEDREPSPVALLPRRRAGGAVVAHGGPGLFGLRVFRATDAPAGLVVQVKGPCPGPDRDPKPQPRLHGGHRVWVRETERQGPAVAAIQVREAEAVFAHDPDPETVP